jgi:hypothetical protein
MHVLLTTSQSLLLLDTDSGRARRLDAGRGLYYGIAQHADRIYVAARKRLVSSDVEQAQERGEILMFDRALRPCGSLRAPFALRDLHEIAWHGGKLWATGSYDNMIAVFDGQRWERWFPLGQGEAGDVNHFNSFMFDADRVWILAHNRGPSELLAFSLETRALLQRVPMGNCAHNIWREDARLFTCSSAHGTLINEDGAVLETGGFPRGVAFDAATRCVGVSAQVERKERDFTAGKLLVCARDWTVRHEIDLAGEGLILDLLALPAGFGLERAAPGPWARLMRALGAGGAPAEIAFPMR